MASSNEIRGSKRDQFLGFLIGWFSRLWGATFRVELEDNAGVTSKKRNEPVVYVVWHNRLFASIPLWKMSCGHYPVVALMSASKDGTLLESAVGTVGVEVARGSSSRRGAAALVLLRRALRAKKDVYITPDGPRGPCYELQAGALKLAQAEGVPVVVVQMRMANYWTLNSWDKFRIPKPCSDIDLIYDEPIHILKDLSDEEFEQLRLQIQEQMCRYN